MSQIDFHKILKEERKKHNLSQEELANLLTISRQSISKWEREKGYPTIETLIQLSDIFNITIDELLKGDVYLKNKIITDSKKLKYPKLKTFFDTVTMLGLLLIVAKIVLFIFTKLSTIEFSFLSGSIVYSFGPLALIVIGSIGTDIFSKKYQ